MIVHRDLVYADVGDRQLPLDLYVPDGEDGPYPLLIWVHGGAWRQGSKAHPRALRLLNAGYAVASVEYRLSQEAIFPAQIHDCKAAVRWLRARADEYDLDAQRFGAWGGSAGGHLVALLGTTAGVDELEGSVGNIGASSAVQAVCDWYGPSDFLRMNDVAGRMDHDATDSPESQLLGAPIRERPDLVAFASPITYVTPGAAPFLLMHGTADDTVIPDQSRLLHQTLVDAGAASTLIMLGGLGHGFSGIGEHHADGRWREIYGYVRAFFDATLS
jgi:acetyl esterase/lipase